MATRGRTTARRGSGSRRKMVWARHLNTGTTITVGATGTQLNLLSSFETEYGANLIGATAIRIRGVMFGTPTVAGSGSLIAGVRVSNDADATAGNGPQSSPYADWMLYESFIFDDGGLLDLTGDSQVVSRVVDIRSMRKLEEINEQLTLWLEAAGTGNWRFTSSLSILLKLP